VLGFNDEQLAQAKASLDAQTKEPEYFEVYSENWQILELFISLTTQWRMHLGIGGVVFQGLDYIAVESVMRMLKIKAKAEVFNGLQVMEKAAMEILNDRS